MEEVIKSFLKEEKEIRDMARKEKDAGYELTSRYFEGKADAFKQAALYLKSITK